MKSIQTPTMFRTTKMARQKLRDFLKTELTYNKTNLYDKKVQTVQQLNLLPNGSECKQYGFSWLPVPFRHKFKLL